MFGRSTQPVAPPVREPGPVHAHVITRHLLGILVTTVVRHEMDGIRLPWKLMTVALTSVHVSDRFLKNLKVDYQ